ncbi:MAG: type II secretion system F family protein [Phycisphaerales bacterium]
MKFSVRGYDRAGKAISEVVEAMDRAGAAELMLRRGVFAGEIEESREDGERRPAAAGKGGGSKENLAGFLRQLSILVRTGTPLIDAITAIERQTAAGKWRDVIAALRARLEEGAQLSEAMAAFPKQFDGVCRSLVSAGESGGGLDAMLTRLAGMVREQQKIRKTVVSAMVYPCLLICIAFGVTGTMVTFVLPRFEGLFKTLNTPLPPSTRVLMQISHTLHDDWMYFLAGAIAVVVGGWMWVTKWDGWEMVLGAALRVPLLGTLLKDFSTARIARVLGVLLEGRVSMIDAIRLTRLSVSHPAYSALLGRVEEAVTRGESISTALDSGKLIRPSVIEAVRSAERSGQVGTVLVALADYMDEDNAMLLRTVTNMMEPLILMMLGVVVGSMAISMFLPLFDLTAAGGAH